MLRQYGREVWADGGGEGVGGESVGGEVSWWDVGMLAVYNAYVGSVTYVGSVRDAGSVERARACVLTVDVLAVQRAGACLLRDL